MNGAPTGTAYAIAVAVGIALGLLVWRALGWWSM